MTIGFSLPVTIVFSVIGIYFQSFHDIVENVLSVCFNMHEEETCILLKKNQRSLVLLDSYKPSCKQYLVICFGKFLLKSIYTVKLLSSVSMSTLLSL